MSNENADGFITIKPYQSTCVTIAFHCATHPEILVNKYPTSYTVFAHLQIALRVEGNRETKPDSFRKYACTKRSARYKTHFDISLCTSHVFQKNLRVARRLGTWQADRKGKIEGRQITRFLSAQPRSVTEHVVKRTFLKYTVSAFR